MAARVARAGRVGRINFSLHHLKSGIETTISMAGEEIHAQRRCATWKGAEDWVEHEIQQVARDEVDRDYGSE